MTQDKVNIEPQGSPSKIEGVRGSMTSRVFSKNSSKLKHYRRELRNNSTVAEQALWNRLKCDQVEGLRFRRQYSIDNFILDFYCPKLKLCIELDGDYHFHVVQPMNDYERDEILKSKYNITTLRFENYMVFEQPFTIINAIINFKESHEDKRTLK